MDTPVFTTVLEQVDNLSVDEQFRLLEHLATNLRQKNLSDAPQTKKRRILGLFASQDEMWMADDCWFGEEQDKP